MWAAARCTDGLGVGGIVKLKPVHMSQYIPLEYIVQELAPRNERFVLGLFLLVQIGHQT